MAAESLIAAGREGGDWVCLQNCHLASSWMPALEMLLESHQTMKLNDEFRLWLWMGIDCDFQFQSFPGRIPVPT